MPRSEVRMGSIFSYDPEYMSWQRQQQVRYRRERERIQARNSKPA